MLDISTLALRSCDADIIQRSSYIVQIIYFAHCPLFGLNCSKNVFFFSRIMLFHIVVRAIFGDCALSAQCRIVERISFKGDRPYHVKASVVRSLKNVGVSPSTSIKAVTSCLREFFRSLYSYYPDLSSSPIRYIINIIFMQII